MAIDYDKVSKAATASGALEGAGTGAMLGSYFAPGVGTAVGAGLGGLWGAVQGARDSKAQRTEYDIEEEKRLLELKTKMENNTLGLTEDEKAYLYSSGQQEIDAQQDVAKQMREQQLASAYQGGGTAFGKQIDAEKQRVEAAGKLGINVAEADMTKKMTEEAEYWGRLANVSKREAEQQKANAEASQKWRDDFNEFIIGEVTESGAGGEKVAAGETASSGIEAQFGLEAGEAKSMMENVMNNGSLRELLFSTMGGKS
tara:strand:- start:1265 stop:2035 length:771 start_codon:yes stop_codon:yes gene_type:complete